MTAGRYNERPFLDFAVSVAETFSCSSASETATSCLRSASHEFRDFLFTGDFGGNGVVTSPPSAGTASRRSTIAV